MKSNLAKHVIGIFFTFILVFSTNMQGIAAYMDYQMKLENKVSHQKKSKKVFSQTSSEEENNNSAKEITEKMPFYHQIKSFSFYDNLLTSVINFHHTEKYNFINSRITTPPPQFLS